MDHGLFTQHRAMGRNLVIQCVWVYEHPIDFERVQSFHRNLGYGLAGRRIESSPLPFGPHRWVLDRGPSGIDVEERPRPRAELGDWIDERSQIPIDAENGPGWHIGVVPLEDGCTAVSLVVSHYLVDGLGLVVVLVDALMGNTHDLPYPPPDSRRRLRAVAQDSRLTLRDAPEVGRAVRLAARLARQRRRELAQSPAPAPPPPAPLRRAAGDDVIVVPGITIRVDLAAWDARAEALGGTSNTLTAAFAAKLGEHLGRRRAGDGAVTLQLPVSERGEGDLRANAMLIARVSIDPTGLTTDLHDMRAAIRQALKEVRQTHDESLQLAWLLSFTPKRALKRMDDATLADPEHPVFCSNLGDVGSVVNRLDGTDAEYATARVTAQHESRERLERTGGQLILQSLRIPGSFIISVDAYQPGFENTKPALRELAARTLAEFGLAGRIE
ncbi:hypothetical protein [Mycobacterium sp. E740]|uniref:hypothetical protein n=1 Tax=Mycobacterium sp. E740 TaxID=1834149 RepID=UPI0008007F5E|nr:hypothetical protein [Mycobacterium sp. E740]OBI76406.1 hypothetical protein A5663_02985 [Mycobacterium sp. E740]